VPEPFVDGRAAESCWGQARIDRTRTPWSLQLNRAGGVYQPHCAGVLWARLTLIVMDRAITHCGTLWTLRRNGETARAEMVDIEGVGLELRYTRNHKPFARRIFTNGAELLRDAAIERFELEGHGWITQAEDPRAGRS
jgi:hypothetical protein